MNFVLRAALLLAGSAMLFSCSDDKSDEPVKSEEEKPAALPESIVDGVCLSGISDFADIEYNEDATVKSMKFQDGTVEFEYGVEQARSTNAGYPTGLKYTYYVEISDFEYSHTRYVLDVSDVRYNDRGFVTSYTVLTTFGMYSPDKDIPNPMMDVAMDLNIGYNADGQIVKEESTSFIRYLKQDGTVNYSFHSADFAECEYQDGNLICATRFASNENEPFVKTQVNKYEYDAVKNCTNIYHTYYPEIAPYYVISQIFSCLGYLGLPSKSLPTEKQFTIYVEENTHVANYQYEYTYGDSGQIVLLKSRNLTDGSDYTRTFKYAYF